MSEEFDDYSGITGMEDLAIMAMDGVREGDSMKVITGAMNLLIQMALGAEDKEESIQVIENFIFTMRTAVETEWENDDVDPPLTDTQSHDNKRAIH